MTVYTYQVKVQSVSGSNKFFIDGYQQPSLAFGHDITYRFDVSDSSNSGHVVKFSTTSDGTHGGGSALGTSDGYTTSGTAGSANAYVQIAVTSSTASTIYYYCGTSGHTAMGGTAVSTSAEYVDTTGVALRKPILGNSDSWGQYINENLNTISGKIPQSFSFPTGTGSNNQALTSNGSGGTTWQDIALTPAITGLTWYSDSGYSSVLSASEAINIDDATYLKVTGENLGSSGVFQNSAYVQIINVTQSNAVVGNNQSGLTGCVTSASHQSEIEWRFTINPTGVGSISAGDTLKVKAYTNGGESLFATGYVISADPTLVTTVSSATISNTASVGTFGGQVAGGGTDANTKLLLNFDRISGTDIEDSSNSGGNGHKITTSGNAVIKSSPFGDGKSAIFFDGTDDQLSIPGHADFNFGTGAFTIEWWMDWIGADNDMVFKFVDGTYSWLMQVRADEQIKLVAENTSGSVLTSDQIFNTNFDLNRWNHFALVRDSTDCRMYLNGKKITSISGSPNLGQSAFGSSGGNLYIGSTGSGNFGNCYLDSIRIVKGTAVYSGDFTVPNSRLTAIANTKLLIHSNANSFNTHKFARTSITESVEGLGFNGSSSKLGTNITSGNTSSYDLDWTNDVTIEMWLRVGTGATNDAIWETGPLSTSTSKGLSLATSDSSGSLKLVGSNGSSAWNVASDIAGGSIAVNNTWTYILFRKYEESGTHKFQNKISTTTAGGDVAVTTTSGSFGAIANSTGFGDNLVFGSWTLTSSYTDMDVKHIRVSKVDRTLSGQDRYSSTSANLIIPAYDADVASDSNTVLLYNQPKFVDSATSGTTHVITPIGAGHTENNQGIATAMAWPSSLKKTGSAGIYLDGTGDYLTIPWSADLHTMTTSKAISIECWIWKNGPPSGSNSYYIWSSGIDANNTMQLFITSGGTLQIKSTVGGTNKANIDSGSGYGSYGAGTQTPIPDYQWIHIAYTRDTSNVHRLYIDGKMQSKQTIDDNVTGSSSWATRIGDMYSGDSTTYFNGYIDSLRVHASTLYTGSDQESRTNAYTVPTKVYGSFKSDTIDTVNLTGTAGTGGGYVTFNNATLSGQTETTSALPAGLTLNETEDANNTATITGDLTASAGSHAINLVARATSDGTNSNIDPNRKTSYSHTISKGSPSPPVLFSARRYVGNSLARDINGFGFQPDLIWTKERGGSTGHSLVDSVRGISGTGGGRIGSDSTSGADGVERISAFHSDGFSFKVGAFDYTNTNDKTYVGWGWKSGGAPSGSLGTIDSTTTSGAGTISSSSDSGYSSISNVTSVTQSVNRDSGFSITKYTGGGGATASFPHNLGAIPEWIVIKRITDGTKSWVVWHKNLTNATNSDNNVNNLYLDLDASEQNATSGQHDHGAIAGPSNSVINVRQSGNVANVNDSSKEYICYAWKAVSGVSAFGTYEGTGASGWTSGNNGGAQDVGFKPRFLIVKSIDSTANWNIWDSFRESSDTKTDLILANLANASNSDANYTVTFDTNGFKFPTTGNFNNSMNKASTTFIYMAFA